jgi:4-oxalocrotonate tautomerase
MLFISLVKPEIMPYIKIEVTREGVTKEQKQHLIKGVTQLLIDVLNKDPQLTHVVIEEVDTDNWGVAGEQWTEIRKRIDKLKK